MDITTALTKFFFAAIILYRIVSSLKNHPDHSAFFARQRWTLRNTSDTLSLVLGFIFLYGILFPLREGTTPPTWYLYTFMWSAVCCAVLLGYYSDIAKPHGIRWVDFGLSKTRFLGSGVPALNVAFVHFALAAAGVAISPLNWLTAEFGPMHSWFDATIIGFVLAFCEELLFRGILYAPVARRTGKWNAIAALSVFECLLHLKLDAPGSVVLLVVLAIFYSIYILTESLWAPLILHIGINVPLWQPMSMAATAHYLPVDAVEILYVVGPLAALVILDTWWLLNYLSRRKARLARKNDDALGKG